jgi:hypothetical protein
MMSPKLKSVELMDEYLCGARKSTKNGCLVASLVQ